MQETLNNARKRCAHLDLNNRACKNCKLSLSERYLDAKEVCLKLSEWDYYGIMVWLMHALQ